jgi:transposase-like protein
MIREITRYPEDFKKGLLKQIENGEIGIEAARRKYGIGGKMTISKWRKKYANCQVKNNQIYDHMRKKRIESALEKELQETKAELYLYKKLIEVSDYFRDPAVKKKIVQRLSSYLGKRPEEVTEKDLPFLKSVLYSESQDKDTTSMRKEQSEEKKKKNDLSSR